MCTLYGIEDTSGPKVVIVNHSVFVTVFLRAQHGDTLNMYFTARLGGLGESVAIMQPHAIHIIMTTSSNGKKFHVTGHLCGELYGHRSIPRTKASDAELWCFFMCAWINGWIYNCETVDLRRHHSHYDVIVMYTAYGMYCQGIGPNTPPFPPKHTHIYTYNSLVTILVKDDQCYKDVYVEISTGIIW